MPAPSSFVGLSFYQHLGDKPSDLDVPWAEWRGDETSEKTFMIPGPPQGDGFLLLNTYDVEESGHAIVINGKSGEAVIGADVPVHPTEYRWQTWMGRINSGVLRQGENTIQITRKPGGDNFVVGGVVVQWRDISSANVTMAVISTIGVDPGKSHWQTWKVTGTQPWPQYDAWSIAVQMFQGTLSIDEQRGRVDSDGTHWAIAHVNNPGQVPAYGIVLGIHTRDWKW